MASYTVCNVRVGKTAFEIHATGCADVARKMRQRLYDDTFEIEAVSAKQAAQDEVDEMAAQEQYWSVTDYRIHACCK